MPFSFVNASAGSPHLSTTASVTHSLRSSCACNTTQSSRVLLASAATWDPSLGDVFPTLVAGATLCIAPRAMIVSQLGRALLESRATHVFSTPALWSLIELGPSELPDLKCVALGGEPIPTAVIARWAPHVDLINTYVCSSCLHCVSVSVSFMCARFFICS